MSLRVFDELGQEEKKLGMQHLPTGLPLDPRFAGQTRKLTQKMTIFSMKKHADPQMNPIFSIENN